MEILACKRNCQTLLRRAKELKKTTIFNIIQDQSLPIFMRYFLGNSSLIERDFQFQSANVNCGTVVVRKAKRRYVDGRRKIRHQSLFFSLTFTIRKSIIAVRRRLKVFFFLLLLLRLSVHISFSPSLLAIVYFMTCWKYGCVACVHVHSWITNIHIWIILQWMERNVRKQKTLLALIALIRTCQF